MEHAKRKTQQYTKYTQYINENVLNEKRNSSINIKCSKFVLFMFFYWFLNFTYLFPFVLLLISSKRMKKGHESKDSIELGHYKVWIDRSINTCNLIEICICEANGCEVGFSEIVSAMEND